MNIDGMPLAKWIDAPYGAFAKAVRKTIDPQWGADLTVTEARPFEVRVDYSYSGRGTTHINVMARDIKEAEELALKEFDKSEPDMWDVEVDDVTARVKTTK